MNSIGLAGTSSTLSQKLERCSSSANCITSILHQFAESLGNAIDAKDPYTSMHSDEVAEISHVIALTMGLTPREADIIHVAGHLHDIGKIGVPDVVLQKQGALDELELQEIRKHPSAGADIIRPVASLEELGIVEMVRHHHERFDGKGYPDMLAGEAIPLGARIIALADTLSAILQNRPYRTAQTFEKAAEEIIRCSGTQFDPQVVKAFQKSSGMIKALVEALSEPQAAA